MREILFCIAFIAFTWVMAGIIGQTLLALSQPKGFDFYVPTKRAILFGYLIFFVGLCCILFAMIPYDQNRHD